MGRVEERGINPNQLRQQTRLLQVAAGNCREASQSQSPDPLVRIRPLFTLLRMTTDFGERQLQLAPVENYVFSITSYVKLAETLTGMSQTATADLQQMINEARASRESFLRKIKNIAAQQGAGGKIDYLDTVVVFAEQFSGTIMASREEVNIRYVQQMVNGFVEARKHVPEGILRGLNAGAAEELADYREWLQSVR